MVDKNSVMLTPEQVKVIRRQIFELNINLIEVADGADLSLSALQKLLRRERRLHKDHVRAILKVLDLKISALGELAA